MCKFLNNTNKTKRVDGILSINHHTQYQEQYICKEHQVHNYKLHQVKRKVFLSRKDSPRTPVMTNFALHSQKLN